MRSLLFLLTLTVAHAQSNDQLQRLGTDQRIKMLETLRAAKPGDLHYQNLQAAAYVQKMRETADPAWLERAGKLIELTLSTEARNYEALRIRSEIELERHNFRQVVEYSKELIAIGPGDPWSYGTLGDALMEMGEYDKAADAYQQMVTLRPDLASYNRAAYYRFVSGDLPGAIELMKKAVAAGSSQKENMAWCLAELGQMQLKAKQLDPAEESYRAALMAFPNYHPALAGLGKTLAAKGKRAEAIVMLTKAQSTVPWPDYAATLRELYVAAGDGKAAQRQMENLNVLEQLGRAQGEKANRGLALAFADAKVNLNRARELAEGELKVRNDVYSWDAVAWVLFQQGKVPEAAEAMGKALRMETPEPLFAAHAAAIAARMFDPSLNATQRISICHALRKSLSPETREKALADPKLAECVAMGAPAAAFRRAMTSEEPWLRALAVRELGRFGEAEDLPAMMALTRDGSLSVVTSALQGLAAYAGPEVVPFYEKMVAQPDAAGLMALQRLTERGHPLALPAARRFLAGKDVGGRLAALGALADLGEASDLPGLRDLAKEHEELTAGGRGFGLMPSISLGRAAKTAVAKIEARKAALPGT